MFTCVHLVRTKQFARLNHAMLLIELLKRGLPTIIVRIADGCYDKQVFCMEWNGTISETLSATNGVKQGGIISPTLFCIYIDIMLEKLKEHPAGCRMSGRYKGTIAYADDIALFCPRIEGLQTTLDVCADYAKEYVMVFNNEKSAYIGFETVFNDRNVLKLNSYVVNRKDNAKHLGNILIANMSI